MNSNTKKHRMWLKAIAIVVMCLFVLNDVASAMGPVHPRKNNLSPVSRFEPVVKIEYRGGEYVIVENKNEKSKFKATNTFKEDIGFMYLSLLIGQALQFGISEYGLKDLIRKHLSHIGFTRFKWEELYREEKTFCLPYERKDDGGRQLLRFYLPDGEEGGFPHIVTVPLGDGSHAVLEDPLDEAGEETQAQDFIDKIHRECEDLEKTFFREFRKRHKTDRGYCFQASYVLVKVLAARLDLSRDKNSPDRIEWEIGEKPDGGIFGQNASHIWVTIYKNGRKAVLIDPTRGQHEEKYFNRIYMGKYEELLGLLGLNDEENVRSEDLRERTRRYIDEILSDDTRTQALDAMAERVLLLDSIRRVVLEAREKWEDVGACKDHSIEVVRRLKKKGIDAWTVKSDSSSHRWVETGEYVIDAFPEGAGDDHINAASDLGDERFLILEKGSEAAERLYRGVKSEEVTARAEEPAEDDVEFHKGRRDHFIGLLREAAARNLPGWEKHIAWLKERIAMAAEKLRKAKEKRSEDDSARLELIKKFISETKKEIGKTGACYGHAMELLRRLAKKGIEAKIVKYTGNGLSHWWVETEEYVIDAYPDRAGDEYIEAARTLGDEGFVIVRKGSEIAERLYPGKIDERATAYARKDAEDDIAFYKGKIDFFRDVLNEKRFAAVGPSEIGFREMVLWQIAKYKRKRRWAQAMRNLIATPLRENEPEAYGSMGGSLFADSEESVKLMSDMIETEEDVSLEEFTRNEEIVVLGFDVAEFREIVRTCPHASVYHLVNFSPIVVKSGAQEIWDEFPELRGRVRIYNIDAEEICDWIRPGSVRYVACHGILDEFITPAEKALKIAREGIRVLDNGGYFTIANVSSSGALKDGLVEMFEEEGTVVWGKEAMSMIFRKSPPRKDKDMPDGSPYHVFDLLRTKFEDEYADAEKIREQTKGRMQDGRLSIDTVKRDLGTLEFLELIESYTERDGQEERKVYRAVGLSGKQLEVIAPILRSLGARPKKSRKIEAYKKLWAGFYRRTGLAVEGASQNDIERLAEFETSAMLARDGKYLVSPGIYHDDFKLIRAIIHEEIEALMQILQREGRERFRKFYKPELSTREVKEGFKKRRDSLFDMEAEMGTEAALYMSRSPYRRIAALIVHNPWLKRLYNKLKGKRPDLPPDLFLNDMVAKAFELMFITDKGLVGENELSEEEMAFLKAARSMILERKSTHFMMDTFWDPQARREVIQRAISEGMNFYEVADKDEAEDPGEEEGPKEVILTATTHSKGIHGRPSEALAGICKKLYEILPGVKITFIGANGEIRIEDPVSERNFGPLREQGTEEGKRHVYKGQIKIVVSGDHGAGHLYTAANILADVIKDEKFVDGLKPEIKVAGADGKEYTSDMLEDEIDKRLNELEASRMSRVAEQAMRQGLDNSMPEELARIEKELRVNINCLCFYWEKLSQVSKLPDGSSLRQSLTEVSAVIEELEALEERKDIRENEKIMDLIKRLNRASAGYAFLVRYLTDARVDSNIALNLAYNLDRIQRLCGWIIHGEQKETMEQAESPRKRPAEVPVKVPERAIPPLKSMEETLEDEASRIKELGLAKAYFSGLEENIERFIAQAGKFGGDKDDPGLEGPTDEELRMIEDHQEIGIRLDILNMERASEIFAILKILATKAEDLSGDDLKLIREIGKQAAACHKYFMDRKKGALLSRVDLYRYGSAAVVMMWRLGDIVDLCKKITSARRKSPPDGSPYRIFEILRTKFADKYATLEMIRENTKGVKDGQLSSATLERDLGTLVSMGIVEKILVQERALFKASDMDPTEWRFVAPVLKSLGTRPTKEQKESAKKKVAKEKKEARQTASPEGKDIVNRDIKFYSQRYGSDNPFMILSVALKKLNWPVIRHLVYYLKGLPKNGQPATMLEEHILLRAEHMLKEYLDKIQAWQQSADSHKNPPPDGSPYRIFEILRTDFKGEFVTAEKVRRSTMGRAKDGHLSLEVVKRDLGTLVYLGLVKKSDDGKKYRAADLSPPEWEKVSNVLESLGAKPDRDRKELAIQMFAGKEPLQAKADGSNEVVEALLVLLQEYFIEFEKGKIDPEIVQNIVEITISLGDAKLQKALHALLSYYGSVIRPEEPGLEAYLAIRASEYLTAFFARFNLFFATTMNINKGKYYEEITFGIPEYHILVNSRGLRKIVLANLKYTFRSGDAGDALTVIGHSPQGQKDVYVSFGPKLGKEEYVTVEDVISTAIHEAQHKFDEKMFERHFTVAFDCSVALERTAYLAVLSKLNDKRLLVRELLDILMRSNAVMGHSGEVKASFAGPHVAASKLVEEGVIRPACNELREEMGSSFSKTEFYMKLITGKAEEIDDEIIRKIQHFAAKEYEKFYKEHFGRVPDYPDITSLPIEKIKDGSRERPEVETIMLTAEGSLEDGLRYWHLGGIELGKDSKVVEGKRPLDPSIFAHSIFMQDTEIIDDTPFQLICSPCLGVIIHNPRTKLTYVTHSLGADIDNVLEAVSVATKHPDLKNLDEIEVIVAGSTPDYADPLEDVRSVRAGKRTASQLLNNRKEVVALLKREGFKNVHTVFPGQMDVSGQIYFDTENSTAYISLFAGRSFTGETIDEFLKRLDVLEDKFSKGQKGSPAKCIETIFLSESLRGKNDISVKKDLWPEREKVMAGVSLRTVQKEVEILTKAGILIKGEKPHTYRLRPELQDLPPPIEGALPAVIARICEIEHDGIRWLGRYDIKDTKTIDIVRSKIGSVIERYITPLNEAGFPAKLSRYYSDEEIPVRNPGGIKEEQALIIKNMAELLYDKWGVDIYIRKKGDKTYHHATDLSAVRGLKVKNREKVQVTAIGYTGLDDLARKKQMLSRTLDLVERLLQDPYAMTFSAVDPELLERYFEEAGSELAKIPVYEATFPRAYDIYDEESSSLQAIFAELGGHNIMWSIAGEDEPGRPLTVNLTGGKSEEQLKRIMSVIGRLIKIEQGRLSREDRARALVTHDMVLAIMGEEVKDDFPKKEMDGSHKHPFFPRENLFWSANSHSGNIDFTLGQRKWGRFEIFVTEDGRKVYVTPYMDDIKKGDEVEYFSMDISDPKNIGRSLIYRYGDQQLSLGELLPGSSLGPEDKINRNRVIGILGEALSLRKEMMKRPGLDYYFMIDRFHQDDSMDVLSRNVLMPDKDPRKIGNVETGTPIPDFYATDPQGRLALLVESGTYTPKQLAEKLFNGYRVLTGKSDPAEIKDTELDVAEELVLSVNIPRSKKKGDFTRRARRTIELFLIQLKYKKERGEAVKVPQVIIVEDLYSNLSVAFKIDNEKLEIEAASEVSRFDDISYFTKLSDFIFASEKEITDRREEEKIKAKVKRAKELFGENVITDELDLDHEFQQFVEEERRRQFLKGNEGVVNSLEWEPNYICIASLLQCTSRCPHCLVAAGPERKEKMSIEDMAKALSLGNYGDIQVSMVGGEVLLRKDIIEIIRKFPIYSLSTNASTMDTAKKAEKFIVALRDAFEDRITEEGRQAEGFRINISVDDLHMSQSSISAEKIANLIEAVMKHYPKAMLNFLVLFGNWGEASGEVKKELEDRGFTVTVSRDNDKNELNWILRRKTGDDWQEKRIAIDEKPLARIGRALSLPDRSDDGHVYFAESNIDDGISQEIPDHTSLRTKRVVLDPRGNFTVYDSWIGGHSPLLFGNAVQEGWINLLIRLNRDPLFRAVIGGAKEQFNFWRILKIAEEYDPDIARSIDKGKHGGPDAFFYWLLSNPERKLYVTYRLLNELHEEGVLKGTSPFADMTREEIKALVKKQVKELRGKFLRWQKAALIEDYYQRGQAQGRLTKARLTEGGAFMPSEVEDIFVVAEHLLAGRPDVRVLDLGGGNAKAGNIFSLYADVKMIEIDTKLYREGWECIKDLNRSGANDRERIDFAEGDFFEEDFSRHDVLYIYWPFQSMGSKEGARLAKKVLDEMRPDSVLVVNSKVANEIDQWYFSELEEVDFPGDEAEDHPNLKAYKVRKKGKARSDFDDEKERRSAVDFSDALRMRAAEAKNRGEKVIIGLDTDWITDLGSQQQNAIQELLNDVNRLPDHLKKMGLVNVIIVRGRGNALGQDILIKADNTNTPLANVVVLASGDTLKNQSFNALRSTSEKKKAFIAEVDPSELIEEQAKLRYTSEELFVPYLKMIEMALKLAFGENVPLENEFVRVLPDEERPRVFYFIPKARPVDINILDKIYERQRQAIIAA